MALRFRPHTITVALPTESINGPGERTEGFGEPITVRCMMEPMTPGSALAAYGLETRTPFRCFINWPDAENFKIKGRIVWQGVSYAIMSEPGEYAMDALADHATILTERLQ
jgi:predicted transcriptional regulator of viral defense system